MVPSIVVAAVCWSIAPFVGYWLLLALAALAGLFVIPSFSIIRQAVIAAVPEDDRRTAISLDSVAVEMSFMVGPALGVWAATIWPTSWVLFSIEMLGVAAGVLLWVANPVIRESVAETLLEDGSGAAPSAASVPRAQWFRAGFLAVCLGAAATTVVLGAPTSPSSPPCVTSAHSPRSAGCSPSGGSARSWAAWSTAGCTGRSLPSGCSVAWAWSPSPWPSRRMSRRWRSLLRGRAAVRTDDHGDHRPGEPDRAALRGEAMGWHGSFMTAGMALGAPAAGVAIDLWGWGAGFALVAVAGMAVATLGATAAGASRGRRAA